VSGGERSKASLAVKYRVGQLLDEGKMTKFCKFVTYAFSVYLIGVSVPAMAATYYVATTGSNSNPGTQSTPFHTITHAYSVVVAGDTILVQPGTYTDSSGSSGIMLNKIGTASAPITLKSVQRGGAIINGQTDSRHYYAVTFYNAKYNVIDGFKITGARHSGIGLFSAMSNKIINNEIYNNGSYSAITPEHNGNGIFEDKVSSGQYYGQNFVHDNGSTQNLDHGLYLCGSNSTVVNNIVSRNAYGWGLHIAGYSTVSNMNVYHNTFAYNGRGGIMLWLSLNKINISNNIFYGNVRYGIDSWEATGSGVTISNNIFYNNASGNYSLSGFVYTLSNVIAKDPVFVTSTDFHLRDSSPAAGAGVTLSSVTQDYDGKPRPSGTGWDIGAYASGSGIAPPPPPPQNLIQNGSFGSRSTNWMNWGNTWIVSGPAIWDGSNAIEVGTGAGGVGQNVTGWAPGKSYTLTFRGRAASAYDPYAVGASFYDANGRLIGYARAPSYYNNTTWQTMTVPVPVPTNTYIVRVWVWKNAGSSFIFVDDLSLR